jgi:hypothetical protein
MSFKGIISTGDKVEATFSSNCANSGSASLLIGVGLLAGGADASYAVIAAGGGGTVNFNARSPGILKVFVDVAEEGDSGILEVAVSGAQRDRETVSGDTIWTYSVE